MHAPLIAWSVLVVALIAVFLGSFQLRPIVFSTEILEAPAITHDVRGEIELFDHSVGHSIDLAISEVEYEKMKTDFQSTGEKTWIRADVVIDGVRLESVGIRLKGNSTLMGLRGQARGGPGQGPGGMGAPPGGMPPGGMPPGGMPPGGMGAPPGGLPSAIPSMPEGAAPPGGAPAMSSASFDDPSTLPLVISFNQFVRGRGYQGRTELAVRPVGGAGGANLNEAVSLQAIAESGQASQRFTWVRFSMNGATARTRLVVENPDQNYAVALGRGTGALFKSKATNTFSYKGEDPTAYVEDFEQLSANGSLDLAPLIALLDFVDHASDDDFDANLSRWVDVERLALYAATHDLLNNFDDMSGPGRNFMLWYDSGDRRFTVITWDMNLAITGMGGGKGMGGPPASFGPESSGFPAGAPQPPPGDGMPGAAKGGGGAMRMGNTLKTRFLNSTAMADLRQAARAELVELWFAKGRAAEISRELAAAVPETEALPRAAIDEEVDTIVAQLEQLSARASEPVR